MSRDRMVWLAILLLSAALAAGSGLIAHRTGSTVAARAEALAAAEERMPLLLSYDATSLNQDLERAIEQTTGAFSKDYRKILREVVEPTAKRRQISTTAKVSAAGVVSGDGDKVVVLVFLTQATTAQGDRSSVSGSRVQVTMERAGDEWKISGLQPV